MTRLVPSLTLILSVLSAVPVTAQDVDTLLSDGIVSIRAQTEPEGQAWFAQQTRFNVEIRTTTWFTDAPRYPEIHLSGAIAVLPGGFATNYTEREGGVTYTVQRKTYLIYPQRSGSLTIPSITVRFGISIDGKPSELLSLTTQPLQLDVRIPEQATGLTQLVTTPQLRVTDRLSQDLDKLQVGDAVTRTITMTAADSLALMLPDLQFAAPPGITMYPAQPILNDSSNRGQFSGERVESATFVLESAGDYRLPEIEIHWWNPASERLNTETLEALEFSVAAGSPITQAEEPVPAEAELQGLSPAVAALEWLQRNVILVTGMFASIYVLCVLGRRYVPWMLQQQRRRREKFRTSENYYFRQLIQAFTRGDEDETRRRFWAWIDCLPGIYTVADFAVASGAPEIAQAWQQRAAARYGSGGQQAIPVQKVSKTELAAARDAILRSGATSFSRTGDDLNPQSSV